MNKKPFFTRFPGLSAGLFSLATALSSAQTEYIATTAGSEMSDSPGFSVSDSDLLQTSVDTVNASSLIEGTGVSGDAFLADKGEPSLRDGIWGNNEANSRGTAAVQNDEFAEYLLDLTASPGGYTISGIDFYTNWGSGQGRDEVRVTVSFSLVETPAIFDQVLVVSAADPLFVYNPPTQTQGKLSLSDFSVSGVAAIRFDWPGMQENNAVGYSEIDVFGTSTGGDIAPPTLSATSPANEALDVATTLPIVLTFNEDVQAGAGMIDLRTSTPDASVETFDAATSGQLEFDGRTLTITPSAPLMTGVEYQLIVSPGAVDDLSGNDFAGIVALPDPAAFRFTTDDSAPVLGTVEPLLNGLPSSDLILQFNEAVQLGSGQITLHLAGNDQVLQTITVPSDGISALGNSIVAEIEDLQFGTEYYLNVSAGAITDLSGIAFPAVTDRTSIAFTTVADSLIHHWEFEDEVTDSPGTHDGTLRGNPPFIDGQVGRALDISTGGNGVAVNQSSLPASNFTMACWINPAATNGTRHIAGTRRGQEQGAQLRIAGGVATVILQSETRVALAAPEPLLENVWVHLAFTVDPVNGLTLYVNGIPVATDPSGISHTTVDNFTIGFRPDVVGESYVGLVDDLRIYAEVLSANEVARLANNEPEPLKAPEIVAISTDDNRITLSWTSTPGESYSVLFSTDLSNFDGDVSDDISAAEAGDLTEFTFSSALVGVNVDKAFFRVLRN